MVFGASSIIDLFFLILTDDLAQFMFFGINPVNDKIYFFNKI